LIVRHRGAVVQCLRFPRLPRGRNHAGDRLPRARRARSRCIRSTRSRWCGSNVGSIFSITSRSCPALVALVVTGTRRRRGIVSVSAVVIHGNGTAAVRLRHGIGAEWAADRNPVPWRCAGFGKTLRAVVPTRNNRHCSAGCFPLLGVVIALRCARLAGGPLAAAFALCGASTANVQP
jgi:hypothetical protein